MLKELSSKLRDSVTYANAYPPLPTAEELQELASQIPQRDFAVKTATLAHLGPAVIIAKISDGPIERYGQKMDQLDKKRTFEISRHINQRRVAQHLLDEDTEDFKKKGYNSVPFNQQHIDSVELPSTHFGSFIDELYKNPQAGQAYVELIRETRRMPAKQAARLLEKVLNYFSLKGNEQTQYFIREGLYKYKDILDAMDKLGDNAYTIHSLESIHTLLQYQGIQGQVIGEAKKDLDQRYQDKVDAEKSFTRSDRNLRRTLRNQEKVEELYLALNSITELDPTSEDFKTALKIIKRKYSDVKETGTDDFKVRLAEYRLKAQEDRTKADVDASAAQDNKKKATEQKDECELLQNAAIARLREEQKELDILQRETMIVTAAIEEMVMTIKNHVQNVRLGESTAVLLKKLEEYKAESPRKMENLIKRLSNAGVEVSKPGSRRNKERHGFILSDKIKGALGVACFGLLIFAAESGSAIDTANSEPMVQLTPIVEQTPKIIESIATVVPTPEIHSEFERLVPPEYREARLRDMRNFRWREGQHSATPLPSGPSMTPEMIDDFIDTYNQKKGFPQSPAAGMKLGQFIYDRCTFYGWDPAFIMRIFYQESHNGLLGWAKDNASFSNAEPIYKNGVIDDELVKKPLNDKFGFVIDYKDNGGYDDFMSVTHDRKYAYMMSIEHMLRMLTLYYSENSYEVGSTTVDKPLKTVEKILSKYDQSPGDDVEAYKSNVINGMEEIWNMYGIKIENQWQPSDLIDSPQRITTQYGHYDSGYPHYGLDIGLHSGVVKAVEDMKIVEVETGCQNWANDMCGRGWGNHVIGQSLYTGDFLVIGHSHSKVAVGQVVQAGESIAEVDGDTSGKSTGPHVHFQYIPQVDNTFGTDKFEPNKHTLNPAEVYPELLHGDKPEEGVLFGTKR